MIRKAVIVLLVLAALGTATPWVASHWANIWWTSDPESLPTFLEIAWFDGRFRFTLERDEVAESDSVLKFEWGETGFWVFWWSLRIERDPPWQGGLTFLRAQPASPFPSPSITMLSGDSLSIGFPGWWPPVLLSIYPAVAFIRGPLRRWRRRRQSGCIRCGYNLTGNVSGRCPECGKEVVTT